MAHVSSDPAGVTGGIAAYRALELARLATKQGHAVRVVMTQAATRFVGAASFEGIVGAPVLISEWDRDPMRGGWPAEDAPTHDPIGHLALAEGCDAFLVAPASANTISKLAAGAADSMLTTSFLACDAPRLVAPAMNDRMYRDAATQRNLELLRERGVEVIEPDEGALASRGEHGTGRLPQPEVLLARVEGGPARRRGAVGRPSRARHRGRDPRGDRLRALHRQPLERRMGVALAEAAARRGADVTLVAANVSLPISAAGSKSSASRAPQSSPRHPHAAFVARGRASDGRGCRGLPARAADGKLTREGSGGMGSRLTETEDVVASLARERRAEQTLVGFAAEHGAEAISRAREKLDRKGLDAIVFNDISRPEIGFDSARNEVTIVTAAGERAVPETTKEEVAEAVLDEVSGLRDVRTLKE